MSVPVREGVVLVTGGAGFAGSYIVRALVEAGREVVVLDVSDYRPESREVIGPAVDRIPFVRASMEGWPDVVETFVRHRPGAVIHAGNLMDIEYLDRNPRAALTINVVGTVNLLEAARLFDVRRFILFSSIGVLPRVMYEPIDGNHPVILADQGPAWAYSTGKLCGELFGYTYQRSFGLDIRIIRPSAVYGFGMSWNAPNGIKQVVEPAVDGVPVRLASGGTSPRDYIHATDLASLTVSVLEGPDDADRIFYGGTGRPLTLGREVCELVRELVPGADIEIEDVLTEDEQIELCCRGVISIDNALGQLGWRPRYLDLREGVSEYIGAYRAFRAKTA